MKIFTVGNLKSNFSSVLKQVQEGEEIGIAYGKGKEVVALIVPNKKKKPGKRKLGILEGKVKITFKKGFKMTEDEFLNG